MITLDKTRKGLFVVGVLACLCTTIYGEVGVVVDSRRPHLKNPYLHGIIDDPDPSVIWRTYEPSSSRKVLNPGGVANADGKPSLIRNHVSGIPVAVWSRNSQTGYDVVVTHFANGEWSDPLPLADATADELDPFLTVDPADGTFHLVYWVDDTPPRVMHRQAPADLSSWTQPVQVSQPQENACTPSAVVHEGLLRVVYEVHDLGVGLTPRQIVIATSGAGGFAHEALTATWYEGKNAPEIHSSAGVLWVDWIDADDAIAWIRQNPQTGAWQPIRTELFESIEERDYRVRGGIRFKAWGN
jgi:hypothetical protein